MSKTLAIAALAAALALGTLAAATGPALATYPGANDGRLAFGINVKGNTDVYSVLPNGRDLRRLTDDPGFDACAAYSADGKQIAYCSGQGGGPVQVWTMEQNGKDKQQVTHMSGAAIFPDFSPDGSELVFTAKPADSTTRDIYVIGSDGNGLVRLTSGEGNNAYPAFSPDGGMIAFTSDRTGTWQVYVMNADGSGQTQLTFDAQPKDQVPDWSPDGREIAYLADTHGVADTVSPSWGDIWVMNADGSEQHPLTSGATDYGVAWSPDGTRIATLDWPTRTVCTLDATNGGDRRAVHPGGVQFVPGWQPRGTGGDEDSARTHHEGRPRSRPSCSGGQKGIAMKTSIVVGACVVALTGARSPRSRPGRDAPPTRARSSGRSTSRATSSRSWTSGTSGARPSSGTLVAQEHGLSYPGRVDKLVLISTATDGRSEPELGDLRGSRRTGTMPAGDTPWGPSGQLNPAARNAGCQTLSISPSSSGRSRRS
jgi:WD40 repeat protein